MNACEPLVRVRCLSKRFGKTQALDAVDLDIQPGRIIGLLGSNGAGKSTLLRHLVGLYLPDQGQCLTLGREARDLDPSRMAQIGYVHQEGGLIEWMRAGQLIRYVAAHYPSWDSDLERRCVEEFGLDLDARVGKLSPGQRQKVAILFGYYPGYSELLFFPVLFLIGPLAMSIHRIGSPVLVPWGREERFKSGLVLAMVGLATLVAASVYLGLVSHCIGLFAPAISIRGRELVFVPVGLEYAAGAPAACLVAVPWVLAHGATASSGLVVRVLAAVLAIGSAVCIALVCHRLLPEVWFLTGFAIAIAPASWVMFVWVLRHICLKGNLLAREAVLDEE